MHESGTHLFPAMDRVIFGKPAAQALVSEVDRLGSRRVFIIASGTLDRTTDEIEKLRTALGDRFAGHTAGPAQHTSRRDVVAITHAALDANADLLVTIGGGSAIDAGKIVTLCMQHRILDAAGLDGFEVSFNSKGMPTVPSFEGPTVRMIGIPTTLSGGEYNAGCLVTDTNRELKQTFFHTGLMPVAIILDPSLTRHAPEHLYLGSGTRAMDHAIEALCSARGNPLVDAAVLRGLELMTQWLPRSHADRGDQNAAAQCQIASWLCSFGLQARVPMGASHAIGHVLGGTCHVPHYLCTPVMMPAILEFNEPVTVEAQQRLAAVLGQPGGSASAAFRAFCESLKLPTHLHEVNVTPDSFPLIAKNAMTEFFTYSNPRRLSKPEDVIEILKLAA